ncbi:probable N-acetyltransferase CML1 [Stylophora pistillata]|uniref:probable N-acetyltransferase CML1 n=1 Tax=Stylophora pistillata TaxID=50429 RepID=UPI000C04084F|nr:probable N-acetyltransferase CML1 [Stylophora pistillata]
MNTQLQSLALHKSGNEVLIREFKDTDLHDCQEIFTNGMEQLISLVARVVFPRYIWILLICSFVVFVLTLTFQWIVSVFFFFVVGCVILAALLYSVLYIECWKYIDSCLAKDLKDIKKCYMSSEKCRMWVAEWNGRVVGMVGLIHNTSHKPGVAELQRMSVSPAYRRMGIARKLLDELIKFAKDQQFQKVVLITTNAQTPAIRLYKKYGFKLRTSIPYPQKILSDLQYYCFEFEL